MIVKNFTSFLFLFNIYTLLHLLTHSTRSTSGKKTQAGSSLNLAPTTLKCHPPKLSNGWNKDYVEYFWTLSKVIGNRLFTSLSGPRAKAWPLANRSLPFCFCRYLFCQVLRFVKGEEEDMILGTSGRRAERKYHKLSITAHHDVKR